MHSYNMQQPGEQAHSHEDDWLVWDSCKEQWDRVDNIVKTLVAARGSRDQKFNKLWEVRKNY